jgi:hypothetical protein
MTVRYDRWSGQYVGQADATTATDTTIPDAATTSAATTDITASNYQAALNTISSSPVMNPSSSAAGLFGLSTTQLVVGGIAAVALIWFLTRE